MSEKNDGTSAASCAIAQRPARRRQPSMRISSAASSQPFASRARASTRDRPRAIAATTASRFSSVRSKGIHPRQGFGERVAIRHQQHRGRRDLAAVDPSQGQRRKRGVETERRSGDVPRARRRRCALMGVDHAARSRLSASRFTNPKSCRRLTFPPMSVVPSGLPRSSA